MLRLSCALLAASFLALLPSPASACRVGPPPVYAVDSSLPDDVAPGAVEVLDVTVDRASSRSGCSGSDSCGNIDFVYIALSAQDDQTPSDSMGYVFELVDGDAEFAPPSGPVSARNGAITLHRIGGRGALRYDLEVRAVDQAGNVGPPTLIRVRSGTGCAIGGAASSALPALLALGLLALRRRRRR